MNLARSESKGRIPTFVVLEKYANVLEKSKLEGDDCMSQQEKMKADFEKVLEGYYMQLVYLKDLIAVQEDIENHKEELKMYQILPL